MYANKEGSECSGSIEVMQLQIKVQPHKPSKILAGYALGVGLFGAIGPLLFFLDWNWGPPSNPLSVFLGFSFFAGPIGILLNIVVLVLASMRPHRVGGRRRAIYGLMASVIGVGWLLSLQLSHHAQYGPWGHIRKLYAQQHFESLTETLEEYATAHDGQFPIDLNSLLDADPEVRWFLRDRGSATGNAVTDFHYVVSLDRSCPSDWIVAYAHPELFGNEGGAFLYVDGTVSLYDEPEFGVELERFKKEYHAVHGKQPVIMAPH